MARWQVLSMVVQGEGAGFAGFGPGGMLGDGLVVDSSFGGGNELGSDLSELVAELDGLL